MTLLLFLLALARCSWYFLFAPLFWHADRILGMVYETTNIHNEEISYKLSLFLHGKIVRCQPNYLKTFSLYELDNFINVKNLRNVSRSIIHFLASWQNAGNYLANLLVDKMTKQYLLFFSIIFGPIFTPNFTPLFIPSTSS
jgi:hypothetical protein